VALWFVADPRSAGTA